MGASAPHAAVCAHRPALSVHRPHGVIFRVMLPSAPHAAPSQPPATPSQPPAAPSQHPAAPSSRTMTPHSLRAAILAPMPPLCALAMAPRTLWHPTSTALPLLQLGFGPLVPGRLHTSRRRTRRRRSHSR
ncbi:hypothetical protein DENSPDRAFT_845442 [Dentipellis sp. KUC8613]|nr:hypothetical protein DENSPDRAFT_845442 [Dentipellis sp. KUC8613]